MDESNKLQHINVHGAQRTGGEQIKNTGRWNLPYTSTSNSIGHNLCEDL